MTSKSWFITLSPSLYENIDLDATHLITQSYVQYYAVKEMGKDGTHPHIHVYVSSDKEVRQDNVRRKWLKCFHVVESHSLVIKKVTDGNRLIGEYLGKDANVTVLWSNLPDSLVSSLRETYSKVSKDASSRSKTRSLTMNGAADQILKWAKANDKLPIRTRGDLNTVISCMYQDGFRMVSVLSRLKYVWMEIQAIQNVSGVDFFDVF